MPEPSFGVEITKVTEIEMAAASRGRPTFPSAAPRQAGFVLLSLSIWLRASHHSIQNLLSEPSSALFTFFAPVDNNEFVFCYCSVMIHQVLCTWCSFSHDRYVKKIVLISSRLDKTYYINIFFLIFMNCLLIEIHRIAYFAAINFISFIFDLCNRTRQFQVNTYTYKYEMACKALLYF